MVIETQSLFDYLGRPAGSDLGQKVHAAAIGKGVHIGTKDIEKSIVPAGYVCMYPISFLNEYFDRKPAAQVALEDRVKALEEKLEHLERIVGQTADKKVDDLPF
tara:strand:+ start:1701 stop:2012 length:312 start_codon:yes stop_codon:yes gene_type:complete